MLALKSCICSRDNKRWVHTKWQMMTSMNAKPQILLYGEEIHGWRRLGDISAWQIGDGVELKQRTQSNLRDTAVLVRGSVVFCCSWRSMQETTFIERWVIEKGQITEDLLWYAEVLELYPSKDNFDTYINVRLDPTGLMRDEDLT